MSNRTKILRTLVVLGVLACIAGAGVFSAFSSQTDNPGSVVTAGSVTLSDNDAGSALYALTAAKPGDSQTSCINVTYTGTLNSTVKIYTPSTIGEAPQDLISISSSAFNRTWTLMHGPCVTIPVYHGPNGMPVGVQVVGPIGSDLRTLAVARAIAEVV